MILKGKEYALIKNRRPGDLVYIGIETSNACNLNCIYCYTNAGKAKNNELSLIERKDVIKQSIKLGAAVMFVAGAGEPLLDKHIFDQIEFAYINKLTTILYTNGIKITNEIAKFLFDHDVTPIVKLESLNPEIHDELTGTIGSYYKTQEGLERLLQIGYGKIESNTTRIGLTSLYTKKNLHTLLDLKKMCCKRNIFFTADIISFTGRAEMHIDELFVSLNDVLNIQKLLGKESSCINGEGCVYWKYGMTIKIDGEADFCVGGNTKTIGNIRKIQIDHLLLMKNDQYPYIHGIHTCSLKDKHLLHHGK